MHNIICALSEKKNGNIYIANENTNIFNSIYPANKKYSIRGFEINVFLCGDEIDRSMTLAPWVNDIRIVPTPGFNCLYMYHGVQIIRHATQGTSARGYSISTLRVG